MRKIIGKTLLCTIMTGVILSTASLSIDSKVYAKDELSLFNKNKTVNSAVNVEVSGEGIVDYGCNNIGNTVVVRDEETQTTTSTAETTTVTPPEETTTSETTTAETTTPAQHEHDYTKYISNGDGTHKVVCADESCGSVKAESEACSGGTATCKDKAVCALCKAEYGELLKHTPAEEAVKVVVLAPTCTTEGSHDEIIYCKVCNAEISRTNVKDPAKHDLLQIDRKEPTCTEDGHIAYWQCKVCLKFYADADGEKEITFEQRILAAEHKIVEDAAVPATCTENGKTAGSHCSVCNAVIKAQEVVPATGSHTWELTKHTAAKNCQDKDVNEYTCKVCKTTRTETVNAVGGHIADEGTVTKEATATDTGIRTYKCTVCGAFLRDEIIPKLGSDDNTIIVGDVTAGEIRGIFAASEISKAIQNETPLEVQIKDAAITFSVDLLRQFDGSDVTVGLKVIETPGSISANGITVTVEPEILVDGMPVTEFSSPVEIKITIPDELIDQKIAFVHLHDGKCEKLLAIVEGNVASCTVDGFSTFTLMTADAADKVVLQYGNTSETTTAATDNPQNTDTPKAPAKKSSGASTVVIVIIVILLVADLGVLVFALLKRRASMSKEADDDDDETDYDDETDDYEAVDYEDVDYEVEDFDDEDYEADDFENEEDDDDEK